jgi:hypothetical protein
VGLTVYLSRRSQQPGAAAKPLWNDFAENPLAVMMSLKTGREQRQTGERHFVPTKVTGTNRHVKKIAAFAIPQSSMFDNFKTGLLFQITESPDCKITKCLSPAG